MFMRARILLGDLAHLGARPGLALGSYLAVAVALSTVAAWSFGALMTGVIAATGLDAPRPPASAAAAAGAAKPTAAPGRSDNDAAAQRDGDVQRDLRETEAPAPRPPGMPARTVVNLADDPFAGYVPDNGDTYRTVCVRLCDGYFWPISFATSSSGIIADRDQCERSCGSPTRLYIHRVPGGSTESMQDLTGVPYTKLRAAFQFRSRFDARCKCTAHPWEQEAKDRHQLYALEEAARKGDKQAAPRVAEVRARVEATRKRETAEKRRLNAQLVAAGIVSAASATAAGPAPSMVNRPTRHTQRRTTERLDGATFMGLGGPMSDGGRERGRRPESAQSGSRSNSGWGGLGSGGGRGGGSDWRTRVFSED